MIVTEGEAIRLVIWDLDETLWCGKLDEGGPSAFDTENVQIIAELAARGIMHSICSNNDFDRARDELIRLGIWDYIVFPSISWSPKGKRISELIKSMQLRPSTVLFIDDEPRNRGEAEQSCPGLITAGPDIVPSLTTNPLLGGKPDPHLTRLQQYKVLENRARSLRSLPKERSTFLRNCQIEVTIIYDLAKHIERAVELINRTNQLNFTKSRLSGTSSEAAVELLSLTRLFSVQAGLVHVRDQYGDYGYSGIFVIEGASRNQRLVHFCFSCRILGMGVENWVYQHLGCPEIRNSDPSLKKILGSKADWITPKSSFPNVNVAPHAYPHLPIIRLHGGCDLDPLAHYFRLDGFDVSVRTNYFKGPLFIRLDTTGVMAASACPTDERAGALLSLGYDNRDIDKQFFSAGDKDTIWILSTWGDLTADIYTNPTLDMEIPFEIRDLRGNLCELTLEEVQEHCQRHRFDVEESSRILAMVRYLREEWSAAEANAPDRAARKLAIILKRLPSKSRIFVVLPFPLRRTKEGTMIERPVAADYNAVVHRACLDKRVTIIRMSDYVGSELDVDVGFDHFSRLVYRRVYEDIRCRIRDSVEEELGWSHA